MASGRSGGRSGGGRSGGGNRSSSGSRRHRVGGGIRGTRQSGVYVNGVLVTGEEAEKAKRLAMIIAMVLGLIFIAISSIAMYFTGQKAFTKVVYDEVMFQDYCNEAYEKEFGDLEAKEDYYLLVLTVEDDEYYECYYMSKTGEHISASTKENLGGDDSLLGTMFSRFMDPTSYEYTLEYDVSAVLNNVSNEIMLDNHYTCEENHSEYTARFENRSDIRMDESEILSAVTKFKSRTDIPLYLIIDDSEDVFGITFSLSRFMDNLMVIGMLLVFFAVGFGLLIYGIKGFIKSKKASAAMSKDEDKEIPSYTSDSNLESSEKVEEEDPFKIDPNDY